MNRNLLYMSCLPGLFVGILASSRTATGATIESTSANLVEISAPASVVEGALESNTLARIFVEGQDYVLPVDLYLDTVGFPPGASVAADGSGGTPGVLAAGTRVDSFYVHFDSVGDPVDAEGAFWTLVFELGDGISGLIYSDSLLDASDYLGAAGTTYPTGVQYRGTTGSNEGSDSITWGQLRAMSAEQSVTVAVDGMRVILEVPVVPVPAAVWLFGSALGLLAWMRRKSA